MHSRSEAPLLVVSPHLDDAVLACGRVLAAHPGAVVLTVFAGNPVRREELTEWDAQCGFHAGDDVVAVRQAEDRKALSRLRAHWLCLDGVENQYRNGGEVDRKSLSDAISKHVQSLSPSTVLVPLGLYHPDHLVASEVSLSAMEEIGTSRWLLYGDVYDLGRPQLVQARLDELRERFDIAPAQLPIGWRISKLHGVAAYRSQLAALGGQKHLARSRWSAPEQLWHCSARAKGSQGDPKITVLIPVFNRAKAVEEAVMSAMGQRCPVPFEVMVVDDGSTDGSAAAASRCGATVIRLDRNQGVARARNEGIRVARSEWVAFLDSDDLWAPNHLATLWAASGGVGLVASSGVRVLPRSMKRRGLPSRRPADLRSPGDALRPENVVGTSACMVRTELLRSVGGFDPSTWPEDLDVWLRVLRETRGRLLPELTVAWRSDGDRVSIWPENSYERVFLTMQRHSEAGYLHPRARRTLEAAACWDRFRSGGTNASSLLRPIVFGYLPRVLWGRFRQRRWRNQFDRARLLEEMARSGNGV